MKKASITILRLGLAATFIWIGVLIFMNPAGWGSVIRPWAAALMPLPIVLMMQMTAALDIAVGILLAVNVWTWAAAFLGFAHIATVLITVGINNSTVRDIGLAAASLALAVETAPGWLTTKLMAWKKPAAKPGTPR